jgi:hypothetical protein
MIILVVVHQPGKPLQVVEEAPTLSTVLFGSLSCVGLREVGWAVSSSNDESLGFKRKYPAESSSVAAQTGFEVTNKFFLEPGQAASKLRGAFQLTRAECPTVELRLVLKPVAQLNSLALATSSFATPTANPSAYIVFWYNKAIDRASASSADDVSAASASRTIILIALIGDTLVCLNASMSSILFC